LAVNTRDWTFTSKISAMLGTQEKQETFEKFPAGWADNKRLIFNFESLG